MSRPRRRISLGGAATAFPTIASALQPALRVRTPALARVTRPPVASAYTVLRAAENDDDTVAVEDEEAASDEADEAVTRPRRKLSTRKRRRRRRGRTRTPKLKRK